MKNAFDDLKWEVRAAPHVRAATRAPSVQLPPAAEPRALLPGARPPQPDPLRRAHIARDFKPRRSTVKALRAKLVSDGLGNTLPKCLSDDQSEKRKAGKFLRLRGAKARPSGSC